MTASSAKRKRDELNIDDLVFKIDYEKLSSEIISGFFHFRDYISSYRSSLLTYFFTHNTNLRTIFIDYDAKIDLKLNQCIAAIKKNPNIISLKFNLARTKKFNQKILNIFPNDNAVRSLVIINPKFNQNDFDNFSFNLIRENSFQHLGFHGLYYQLQYFDAFSQILKHCSFLTSLDLKRIRFPQKLSTFAQALEDNKTLTSLTLEDNMFDCSLSVLFQTLSTHQSLTTINLIHNYIDIKFPKFVSNLIAKNTTCTSLDISRNSFTNASFNLICKSLQINNTIKSFKCAENSCREVISTHELSKVICSNTTLKTLDLNSNLLFGYQPELLFKAFRRNTTLTYLDLSVTGQLLNQNPALVRAILSIPSLQTFNSKRNGLRQNTVAVLCSALQTNTSLTSLDLAGNRINVEYEYLFDVLTVNTTLINLDISSNYISFSNSQKNFDLIVKNSTLKTLNLKNNQYAPELASVLFSALKMNFTLTSLNATLVVPNNYTNRLFYEQAIKKNLTLYELLIHSIL